MKLDVWQKAIELHQLANTFIYNEAKSSSNYDALLNDATQSVFANGAEGLCVQSRSISSTAMLRSA
jgi:hypothetical protein